MESCSGCENSDETVNLKNLSCGHGFCSKCLFQVTSDQFGFMPCPSCRHSTLYALVASTRYQQLSGTLCKYHAQPLDIYCHLCASMICRVCTLLEHRPHFGHILLNKKNETEDHFKDLFEALQDVQMAHKRLEDTSSNILRGLRKQTDIINRECQEISDRIVDQQHEMFRIYLSSEQSRLKDTYNIVNDLKKKASAGLIDSRKSTNYLRSVIEKESSSVNLPATGCKRYIERPFSSLRCELPRVRLSVTMSTPPTHFEDWLGRAIGILWALPKQLLLVVDERLGGGEDLCIYSFNASDLNKVEWSHIVKLDSVNSRAVLCHQSYRLLDELWFWVGVGDKLFQFKLDLRSDGCPMKSTSQFCLQLPSTNSGMTAVVCIGKDTYIDNKFMVITSSIGNSMLTAFGWDGKHEEDIALGRLSNVITDMAVRPIEMSLVICDAGSSIVRSFHEVSLSSLEQYNFTLTFGKADEAIPISVTSNRFGDVFILWLSSEIRKEDVVYAVWNITAQEQESKRTFVVAVGSSLETGIPAGLSCWDHDIVVCFKDGRLRILRNFSSMNARGDDAGEAKALLSTPRKTSRTARVSTLNYSASLKSPIKSTKLNSKLRLGESFD